MVAGKREDAYADATGLWQTELSTRVRQIEIGISFKEIVHK